MKRRRRIACEIEGIRGKLLVAVKREGRITLTNLVKLYGASIDIKDTISDKALAKRQLDILAVTGDIQFQRDGRDLIAEYKPSPRPAPRPQQFLITPRPTPATKPPEPGRQETEEEAPSPAAPELQAIKAYAKQIQAFAEALKTQVKTLTEMTENAKK